MCHVVSWMYEIGLEALQMGGGGSSRISCPIIRRHVSPVLSGVSKVDRTHARSSKESCFSEMQFRLAVSR